MGGSQCEAIHQKAPDTMLGTIDLLVMETIVREKIVDYMVKNNLFSDTQFGFRSLRSCALQLLD